MSANLQFGAQAAAPKAAGAFVAGAGVAAGAHPTAAARITSVIATLIKIFVIFI
jgi:hypothetical protein